MQMGTARKALYALGLLIGGAIIFGMGILFAKALPTRNRDSSQNATIRRNGNGPFITEGFDFNRLRAANNEWRGPDVGVKVDLTRLRMKDGKPLAGLIGKGPIMIVAVNPECRMCSLASDQMNDIRQMLSTRNINYYIVSFASQTLQQDFFKYSDSLNVGVPSFLWDAETGGPPPESVFIMTTPTHLLLNDDGTVIHVWPGSYQDKSVRQRMARQIIADTFVAIDTLKAIANQESPKRQAKS